MRKLNKRDLAIGICFILAISLITVAVYWKDMRRSKQSVVFSPDMSLKELAKKNDAPVKEILHQLSHKDRSAWSWSRTAPIATLPVRPEEVHHAVEHIAEEDTPSRDMFRFILWSAYLTAALGMLVARKKIGHIRTFCLLGTVAVFGIYLGAAPNPMEAVVKVFKATVGLEANPSEKVVFLALFSIMAILGNKLICGWGCQLGALQDLVHRLSPFKQIKRKQVPFWLANGIRLVIFVIFLHLLYGLVFGVKDFVLYHHLNFFKLYSWTLAPLALILLPFLLVFSLFVYRPFCQFICLFGLFSWILENVSLYRVRVSESLCTDCGKCVEACPTQAMKKRKDDGGKLFLPDCWACGACTEACPVSAVVFDSRTIERS
jgi:polyferredoxin